MFRLFHITLLLVIVALGAVGISRLSYNVEILDLLPKGMAGVEGTRLFQKFFDRPDRLIITLKAESDIHVDEAAAAVAETLEAAPGLVRSVRSRPAWETQPDALLELVALAWLNAPNEKIQALEASLAPERIGATLQERIARLSTALDPLSVALDSTDLFGLTAAAREALEPAAAESLGGGGFANADGTFRVVYVDAAQPVGSYREASAWLQQIRTRVETVAPDAVAVGYTGNPAFQAEIGSGMEADMRQSIGGITLIVGVLFWLLHRQIRPLFLMLAAMMGAGLITLGLAGIFFGSLNVMSMGFAAILMGMIEDFGVLGLHEAIDSPGQSFRQIHRRISPAIGWSAVTSASVFGALALSSLPGIAQLGVLTAVGILVGALVMLYGFLPIVMRLGTRHGVAATLGAGANLRWPGFAAAAVAVAAIAVLAVLGLPGVATGPSVLRPKDCQAFEALMRFEREMKPEQETSTWLPVVVKGATDAELAERVQHADAVLKQAEAVGEAAGHYVPLVFTPHLERQKQNLPRLAALAGDGPRLFRAADEAGVTEQGVALARAVFDLWQKWSASPLPRWPDLDRMEDTLGPQLQRTADGPLAVGFVRVPKQEAGFQQPLIAQLQQLPGLHIAGWDYLSDQLKTVLPREIKRVLLPAAAILGLLFFIVFRNARERLLALGSLAFSGLILLAVMRVRGVEWNFVNIGTVPLCLGLGLDFNIHMIYALRDAGYAHAQRVGRALAYCGLSTGLGFGALAMSGNLGLASFGVTSMTGVLATLFVAAFVVPWVAYRLRPRDAESAPSGGGL